MISKELEDEVIRLYIEENYSKDELSDTLGITIKQVQGVLARNHITLTKEQKHAHYKRSMLRKYGVENPSQLKSVQETKRKNCLEKYGAETPFQAESIKAKIRKTNLEKYGAETPFESEVIKSKIKGTMLEKYGVEKPLQNPDIKRKQEDTTYERYGVRHALQSDEFMQKFKDTSTERYGVDSPFKSEEVQQKIKKTMVDKYGVEYAFQNEELRQRYINTMIDRYGVENPYKSEEIMSRMREGIYARTGVYSPSQEHFSKEAFEIINDKDKLEEYIAKLDRSDRTVANISEKLGISYCTAARYCAKHNLSHMLERGSSSYETLIKGILNMYGIVLVQNNRYAISPYEIDLYNEDSRVGIEFNGDYWHSSDLKPANYHQMKSMLAKDKDIFIYHIFEHEWNNPRQHDIIVSQLLNLFNKDTTRIYARKCEVREVNSKDSRKFLYENHIQGYRNATYRYGLYYNNELVSLMTFSNDKFILKSQITEHTFELVRFCSKLGYSVVGGASKLFKYFVNKVNPDKVISYCDIAKGRGITYERLGFKLDKITTPNYHWISFDGLDIKSRYQCQPRFIREGQDDKRTEYEIMSSKEYYQIFDCGSYKYIWNR